MTKKLITLDDAFMQWVDDKAYFLAGVKQPVIKIKDYWITFGEYCDLLKREGWAVI